MDLDEVGEELYGLPPEEFTAARKEQETAARRAGDRELARGIAALGKPSTAAWVCNLLVRRAPDEVTGLLDLGDLLREAQESLAGDQLKELDVQRRRLLGALVRQARSLAAGEGHRVSEAVAGQVEETLRAALADPDAGEALRSGRLTSAMSYSGLGTAGRPDLRVVPRRVEKRAPAPARARTAATHTAPAGRAEGRRAEEERRVEERRRAEEERRQRELDEARRTAGEAARAAEDAEDAARDEERCTQELSVAQEERQQRLDVVAAELDRLREEVTRGRSELDRAERRARSARRRAADAAADRDRAQAHLDRLRADR